MISSDFDKTTVHSVVSMNTSISYQNLKHTDLVNISTDVTCLASRNVKSGVNPHIEMNILGLAFQIQAPSNKFLQAA